MSRPKGYGISGAGVDKDGYESSGHALSAAITVAGRWPDEVAVYVRDVTGRVLGRVEKDQHGNLAVYGEAHYQNGGKA